MKTIRHMSLIFPWYVLTILVWTSCNIKPSSIKCDDIVCDTISTYFVKQIINDKTILYNVTYTDTIKLKELDGEITFEIHQCSNCKGTEYVDILSHDNKTIANVKVTYDGGGQSDKIPLKTLSKYIPTTIKINWEGRGKVFYLTK